MDSRQLIMEYQSLAEQGKLPVSVDFTLQAKFFVWIFASTERVARPLEPTDTPESVILAFQKLQAYCRRKKRPFTYTLNRAIRQ